MISEVFIVSTINHHYEIANRLSNSSSLDDFEWPYCAISLLLYTIYITISGACYLNVKETRPILSAAKR